MIRTALALCALPALAACAAQAGMEEEPDIRAPLAVATGEPQRCLPNGSITRQTVHDDYTIDFQIGGRLYRSTLPQRCPRLGFEKAITYEVRGGQLCTPQIFYVLDGVGGGFQRGPACAFGDFVPIELSEDGVTEAGDAPRMMGTD